MRALLAAGGSGGHLIPALTLAEDLRREGPCWLISSARPVDQILRGGGLERLVVDLQPFAPWRRWLSPFFLARQLRAAGRIWSHLRRVRPEVVVGFGGYLSAAAVVAARLQGIPSVIHEQNLMPGRANRWLARWAGAVAVSFPETARFLRRKARLEWTGNPVRRGLREVSFKEARSYFGFDLERPVLLVMGGSQGAAAVNRAVLKMWEIAPPPARRLQVIHLAGSRSFEEVHEAYQRLHIPARVFAFLHPMEFALNAATLAVSRAGATAMAEMMAVGLPSVLIPYPLAAGHQRLNAHWLEFAGGAAVIEEERLSPEVLWEEVSVLLGNPDRLARMREALRRRSDGHEAERLKALVFRVAGLSAGRQEEPVAAPAGAR